MTPTVEAARAMAKTHGGYPQAWEFTQKWHGRVWLPFLIAAEALDTLADEMKNDSAKCENSRPDTSPDGTDLR